MAQGSTGVQPAVRARASSDRSKNSHARRVTPAETAAVLELSRGTPLDAERRSTGEEVRRGMQHALWDKPSRAAALVRYASARTRRRPARDPGAPRPRTPEHHAALHSRQ